MQQSNNRLGQQHKNSYAAQIKTQNNQFKRLSEAEQPHPHDARRNPGGAKLCHFVPVQQAAPTARQSVWRGAGEGAEGPVPGPLVSGEAVQGECAR